jgi:cation:H+ antiporter
VPVLLLFAVVPLSASSPWTVLWTAPAILISSVLIAWGAESAQFFIAQGFALAILAWLQTAPEFAVEAVLAWNRRVPDLLANLTGALRLLTGLGWPIIYLTAATVKRKRDGTPLKSIQLHEHHAVEVMGLLLPLLYMCYVAFSGSLTIWDGIVLVVFYTAYLIVLSKLPPEEKETLEELETVPRYVVMAPAMKRNVIIGALFLGGGLLIYFSAEPFLASILALAATMGVPEFVAIQWIAPLISEFPEMASTFYWARKVDDAPVALMNMVSSNINQWTLLTAMLPMLLSASYGAVTPIVFDERQKIELLMTLGQAIIGWLFLANMRLDWWEAAMLFVLFVLAFVRHDWAWTITYIYAAWIVVELVRMAIGKAKPAAFHEFAEIWKTHITSH